MNPIIESKARTSLVGFPFSPRVRRKNVGICGHVPCERAASVKVKVRIYIM